MEKLITKKSKPVISKIRIEAFSKSTKVQNDLIRQLGEQKIKNLHHLYETVNLKLIYKTLKCNQSG